MDRYTRRRVLATGATTLALGVAGCSGDGGGGDGNDGPPTVEMTDSLRFEPESITVSTGTTVVWENVGGVGHSITAYEKKTPEGTEYWASGGFDAESDARSGYPSVGRVAEGESYERTFETTGTHEYFCVPHETTGMVGDVVVE